MSLQIPNFPPFECASNPNTVNQRWKKWSEKLLNLFTALNISDAKQKKALLFHYMGEELDDIIETLTLVDDSFESAVSAITQHFATQQNSEFEAYIFRQCKQISGENLDQYILKLKKLAKSCNFESEEREIKSQLIVGCESGRLRRYALQNPSKSLEEIKQYGRINEMTNQQAIAIESERIEEIHVLQNKNKARNSEPEQKQTMTSRNTSNLDRKRSPSTVNIREIPKCNYCGGEWHSKGLFECKARGKTCSYCSKLNHFSKVCWLKLNKTDNQHEQSQTKHDQNTHQQTVNNINTNNEMSDVHELLTTFEITSETNSHEYIHLQIEGSIIKFIMDTGSTKNMLSYKDYVSLKTKVNMNKDTIQTFAYGSTIPLNMLGKITVPVNFKSKKYMLEFSIPDKGPSLIGRKSLMEMGVIKFLHKDEINTNISVKKIEPIENILGNYEALFQGVGKHKHAKIKLHINRDLNPIIQKHRRIPYHIRDQVEKELITLIDNDIIEKVPEKHPSSWISPIVVVPKKDGSLRICIDMTLANKAIVRERHITPTVDDIIDGLKEAAVFSKLDLAKGYHQYELTEDSRDVTTFTTHIGCFRYKRLNFGITSAAEIFQHEVAKVITGIPGTANISDDILVYGKNIEEHDKALKQTLNKLQNEGLTLNKSKCKFRQREVKFMGLIFSKNGILIDKEKQEAISILPNPTSIKEVRSFLGMINFCSKFIPNLASISKPLKDLTRKSSKWIWSPVQQKAIDDIKSLMCNAKNLAFFNKDNETEVWTDAGPDGVGAMLVQNKANGKQVVIAYASHALNDTEKRYSQIEKEAYAVIWSILHFHMYLYGNEFKVITDHKPLIAVFNKPDITLSPRLERWRFKLQPYCFKVQYSQGKTNPADYMSRHPIGKSVPKESGNQRSMSETYINFVIETVKPKSIDIKNIIEETKQDEILQRVISNIYSGEWEKSKSLEPFRKVKYELSTNKDRSIVLRGTRLVIPKTLQKKIVQQAHNSHQGIVRMKLMLRDKLWFPGMDLLAEETVKKCIDCQAVVEDKNQPRILSSDTADKPWSILNIDHKGPLSSGEYLLVIVDQFSKFPVVEIVSSTSAKVNILKLDNIFSTFGNPKTIITDNGSPFQSAEFKDFVSQKSIQHKRITPYWPRANGQVERFNGTIAKIIKIANQRSSDWKMMMNKMLLDYRNTKHSVTKTTTSSLMFTYKCNTNIPDSSQINTSEDWQLIQARIKVAGQVAEARFEESNKVLNKSPKLGDKVLVKREKENKQKSCYEILPLTVIGIKGTMITAANNNKTVTRNVSFFKVLPPGEIDIPVEINTKESAEEQIEDAVTEGAEMDTEEATEREGTSQDGPGYDLREVTFKPRRLVEEI